jgi:hypothetical protein
MTLRPRSASRLVLALALVAFAAAAQAQTPEPKLPIRGLISMGAYKFVAIGGQPVNTLAAIRAKPGIFSGVVLVPSWQQLQPVANGPLRTEVIDNFLSEVRLYNANHARPLAVKLRVWGGFVAPMWAKSIGGPPIRVVQNQGQNNEQQRTLGRFWLPQYRQAWANLQALLAEKYDSEPLIHDVSITSCMSLTAEPFVVNTQPAVMGRLRHAGFTDDAFKDCLRGALADYAPWQRSRLVLSVNPLHLVHVPGPGNPEFTKKIMLACHVSLGERCVFDNHDLNTPLASPLVPIYAYMKELRAQIEFQTANVTPADFAGTIMFGVQSGASAIELYQDFPMGGFPPVANATLRQWSRWLMNNNPTKAQAN